MPPQPVRRGSPSNSLRSTPCAHYVRFTEADNLRLNDAARVLGKSIQGMLHDAAMEVVRKTEKEYADGSYTERPLSRSNLRKKRLEGSGEIQPTGMGIRDRLLAQQETYVAHRRAEPEPAPQTTQVVVNTSSAPDQLTMLAAYVSTGPKWSRNDRLREANKILASTTSVAEERRKLARALEEKIATLEGRTVGGNILDRVKEILK